MKPLPDLTTLTSEQKDELILQLWHRLEDLEALVIKDSSNSSKPPSSDGFKRKTKSRRRSGKAHPGGQKGHTGSTLKRMPEPDEIQLHKPPDRCDACGGQLDLAQAVVHSDGRQVIDLPPACAKVIEHRLQSVRCNCGKIHTGSYPDAVTQVVQYGASIKAAVVYLTQYQHVPMKRCTQLMKDLFGVVMSPASVHAAIAHMHATVAPDVDALAESMLQAPVLHFDETGMRIGKKLHWMHSVSTASEVVYQVHAQRGYHAIQAFNVLPRYNGIAVHDGWPSYYRFNATHALCNAHHLRELEFVFDSTQQQWARDMMALLLEINRTVDASPTAMLPPATVADYRTRYNAIVRQGQKQNPEQLTDTTRDHKKGGIKQSVPFNLLRRLEKYADDVLRFMSNAFVPFTNNLAERDIRMPKLKQKVSGCYRTLKGAQAYCCIRSYLATLQKQSKDVMKALIAAIAGRMPAAG